MARKLKSDKFLFTATLLLICASVVMVYSASALVALERRLGVEVGAPPLARLVARLDDDFIAARGLQKGAMRLLDPAEADRLISRSGGWDSPISSDPARAATQLADIAETATVWSGYMDGAVRSGDSAAEAVEATLVARSERFATA